MSAHSQPAPAVLAELDANLCAATCGVQGLLGLLGEEPGDRPVPADGLRQLLLPLADQLLQAVHAAGLLRRLPEQAA